MNETTRTIEQHKAEIVLLRSALDRLLYVADRVSPNPGYGMELCCAREQAREALQNRDPDSSRLRPHPLSSQHATVPQSDRWRAGGSDGAVSHAPPASHSPRNG